MKGALVALLLCCAAAAPAAEFHALDVDRERTRIVLLDPLTVAAAKDGRKTALVFEVNIIGWVENKIECDCSGDRYRKLTYIHHSIDKKTYDRSADPRYAGAWLAGAQDPLSAKTVATVCGWPKAKSKDTTMIVANLEAAIKRAKNLVNDWSFEDASDMKD